MRILKQALLWMLVVCLAAFISWIYISEINRSKTQDSLQESKEGNELVEALEMNRAETNAARSEYFFRLLRDPATNRIPEDIRSRELNFAKQLPVRGSTVPGRSKATTAAVDYVWHGVGPVDVGGRTRALGIDQRNSNIIIAGGVSGGIWKSTDGGDTWEMKTDPSQNMSVSYLAQDPNNLDTWYYASGEFLGNSARDQGSRAFYHGTGVYKSTDNGESWQQIVGDSDVFYNSQFDYISRIVVSPVSGSIFIASNGFGIYRSTDGGQTWSRVLGEGATYFDVNVGPNGKLVAVVSEAGPGTEDPGVYFSTDDGDSWTYVTPNSFPNAHRRSVAAFAPSDPSIFYVFTHKGSGDNQQVSFHKFTLNTSDTDTASTEDRSANIPNFGEPVGGINVQGGYNMVVRVKPDNPNFVFVGGVNLFRSTDGFATAPLDSNDDGEDDASEKDKYWIGGYAKVNNVSQYSNHHPDQHILAFDPNDPNNVWSGHDGGLSYTDDITASAVNWTDRDEGYVTSQFYTVAIPNDPENPSVVGGTQDNGSPYFVLDGSMNQDGDSRDISSGDGAYAAITDNHLFTSSQLGRTLRYDLDETDTYNFEAYVHPRGAQNQLFIHPYALDPADESIMYYPDVMSPTQDKQGTPRIWVNTTVDEIINSNSGGATSGWQAVDLDISNQYLISALEVSRRPTDVLYYAASSGSSQPKVFKATDASGGFNITDISIDAAQSGAYVHDIALNPTDGNEALVVMSNYSITGLFHTTDGGETWTAVEGNLENEESGSGEGPSLRSATIMPTGSSTIYMVGTSIGLFSTDILDGGNTSWGQESANGLGNTVTEFVTSRYTDGMVAVGSHGRGIFLGEYQGELSSPGPPGVPDGLVATFTAESIELSWESNPEIDITGYNVYKGQEPSELTLFQEQVSATSLQDADTSKHSAYYALTALDNEAFESDRSRPIAAFREIKTVDATWRLVGSPLLESGDAQLPDGIDLIGFEGVYEIVNRMERGRGYWSKHTEKDSIVYAGTAPTQLDLKLRQGWNLVSGIGDTISVSEIQDPNDILSTTPVKEFANNSYQDAQVLAPTGGYFIHAQSKGFVTLEVDTSSSSQLNKLLAGTTKSTPRGGLDALLFSRNGVNTSLLVSREGLSREEKQYFLMPPQAPEPVIDVRTEQGYSVVDENKTEIKVTTSAYPIQVQVGPSVPNDRSYRLIGFNKGEEIHFDLRPGEPVTVDRSYDRLILAGLNEGEIPLTNELSPNYPNPFNPSTTIDYQLSTKGMVSMEVYNLVGRKVQTLVNKVQNPGKYSVTFNASSLSSGTYFVRIKAGDFYKVRKMTLIK
ncbi:T9SS type A sorting domain-containing protein [Aliifodinibius sp. S!AR15-10]|uniref:T9SS type A sorting domain-containing protein n=1 Tax=Aliifodinibius sp. S!AR15-10 TaxID=2950437 RepID=UPI00285DAB7D|nr:T9SS type A sorting domain-containing protein [Aliifodinibius sp. S!AR15-10]MDR8389628.1 T9SS type A sorting domain-containing protein [Aliifodinibius sp. S!AR15-10]